ncbi:MAG: glycosyltransferase family A protein [Lacunisphaera sp.]
MREGPLSEDKTAEDIERLHASRDDVSAINEHSNAIVAPIRQPLVSIIIPCYNAETWVAEAIESALAQTWPNKEVIVIDDGSTDKSLEVIKRYDGCIRWVAGLNRGACAARNRGIELGDGRAAEIFGRG